MAATYKFCAGYGRTPGRGGLLVLYGNNGCGKTHLAKKVFVWASTVSVSLPVVQDDSGTHCPMVRYFYWPRFLDNLKGGAWELVYEACEADLLILDELGGGYDPTRLGVDKLGTILSHREKKWTMATTNLEPTAWEEALDRRVASRLFRNAVHVDLSQVPDHSTL